MSNYDAWKLRSPDDERNDEDHRTDDAEEGYRDGWQHGYESALNDVRQMLIANVHAVQFYGEDRAAVLFNEALDAIRELAKAKP